MVTASRRAGEPLDHLFHLMKSFSCRIRESDHWRFQRWPRGVASAGPGDGYQRRFKERYSPKLESGYNRLSISRIRLKRKEDGFRPVFYFAVPSQTVATTGRLSRFLCEQPEL